MTLPREEVHTAREAVILERPKKVNGKWTLRNFSEDFAYGHITRIVVEKVKFHRNRQSSQRLEERMDELAAVV